MQEIIAKLRKYEIKIRKAINAQMRGNYNSIFKGSGLEFDDVRNYHYGDDVRRIDWNVSAKGHGTFIKVFREEKEQTVFVLLDVSASQAIGKTDYNKIQLAKEIAGVLILSAAKENSYVGLICYSDQKEKYMRPQKNQRHSYEMVLSLFKLIPKSTQTSLKNLIRFALNIIKRKSVIILISDFIDDDYLHDLKGLGEKHDLVLIHVYDEREVNLPTLGILPLHDKESGKTIWQNTSSKAFQKAYQDRFQTTKETLEDLVTKMNINYL
ncbi:MAG: DUF58 domain-containing protein, partial [Bacteroidota bacterium]